MDYSGLTNIEDEVPDEIEAQIPDEAMPGMASEPGPEPTEQFGAERRQTINTIKMLLCEFPDKLADYKKTDLESLSGPDLIALRDELFYVAGAKGNLQKGVKLFIGAVNMTEHIACNYTPLKLEGLTNCIDADIIDDVKLVLIKNAAKIQIEPEARIAFSLASTALMLHTRNTYLEKNKAKIDELEKNKTIPEVPLEVQVKLAKLNEKFTDL